MTTKSALATFLLAATFAVSGCETIRHVPVTPACTAPPKPTLPAIDKRAVWGALGDAEYRRLEAYIDSLWAYSDEQAAIIAAVCNK